MPMPVSANPAEHNLEDPTFSDQAIRWAVCRTRPNREKRLAHFLNDGKIPYFLPLIHSRNPFNRTSAYLPLFPGYLFIGSVDVSLGNSQDNSQGNNQNITPITDVALVGLGVSITRASGSTHAASFIQTRDQARLRSELALIASEPPDRRTLRLENPDSPNSPNGQPILLKDGQLVEVVSPHPFKGQFATLEIGPDGHSPEGGLPRLWIKLQTLGTIVSIEIDPEFIRLVAA